MSYRNYYLQASELSDRISSGEIRSVKRPQSDSLVSRKERTKEPSVADRTQDMVLDYFVAIDSLPTSRRPKARPDTFEKEVGLEASKRPPWKGADFVPQSDKDLLAATLQAEAGNQGFNGMVDVGSVIFNRLSSGEYGDTLEDVIMAPGQFSVWNSVTGYAGGEQGKDMNFKPSKEAYRAAEALLSGDTEDRTGGALNYFAIIPGVSEKPKWANDDFKKIGDHYFGKA